MIVSWGYEAVHPSGSNLLDYNQLIGTRDFSAFLTVPACIEFMHQYEWPKVVAACHLLTLEYAPIFHDCLGTTPISPLNDQWIGQMVSVPIRTTQPETLQKCLYQDYKIEVPLMRQGEDIYIRYSIQVFNTRENLEHLLSSLTSLRKKGELIQ